MILTEIVLAIILTFGLGSYIGMEAGKKQVVVEKKESAVWPPASHVEMIKSCGIVCGERNVMEYNVTYGKCLCYKEGK